MKRVTLALFAAAISAAAIDITQLKPQGYVSDFAGVVDARSKTELERYGAMLKERTGAEIALVTVKTLDGDPIEDVANKLFIQWGVGEKGKDNGVMLLLAIDDRRSRMEVGYGLEPILPDGSAGGILRQMRPALREQQYGDALIAAAAAIGQRIAQEKGVTLDGAPQPQRRRDEEGRIPPIVIIVGIIVLIIFISSASNRGGGPRGGGGIPWWLLLMNSGRGGGNWNRSGGGFGGYDSGGGGGFGGFGGGSSGGGGASSGW